MKNSRVYILRESVVKITQMLSGKGIRVTQQGVNAYVKANHLGVPVVVNLPYMPDNASEELCNAIQGFLDHEVAHILFTDFPMMGKANAEGGKKLGFLLNALEDPRIEKEMAKRFQGSAYNLDVTGKFYLDKFVVPRLQEKAKAGDAEGVMSTLMVPMIRAMSGQRVFKEFMKDHWASVESVYKRIEDLADRIEGAKSTEECFEVAREIVKRLKGDPSKEKDGEGESKGEGKKSSGKSKSGKSSGEDESGEKSTESGKSDGSSDSDGESDKKSDDAKDKGDSEDKSDSEGEGESEDKNDEEESGADGKGDSEETGDIGSEDEAQAESGIIGEGKSLGVGGDSDDEMKSSDLDSAHPIWDALDKDSANGYDESMSKVISESAMLSAKNADYLPFTTDYDVIEKLPVGRGYSPLMAVAMFEKVEHMVAPLQKDLERAITARSMSTRSHGHRSGRLSSSNLSRLAVGDDRVFSRKHENLSKDVAVELVVDASGSMAGSKIHTACQAAYALSSVLERLNIKNEVICFTTKDIEGAQIEMYTQQSETGIRFSRAEGIYMPILKTYQERMTASVKERFAWLPNTSILRSNVDGECVEIAARRLMGRKESGKIMIVLSDGYPAASGSRGDLERHLERVVKDVETVGIKVVGIGIESDAVRRFYPRNLVLNRVEDLPTAVIKELRRLLMQ